jgi:SAM-dependent methyltransferase
MSIQQCKFPQQTLDKVMNYWDQRPCNIRHSSKSVGTSEYFDEVEARKYYVEPHIPQFAEFPRWQGKRVLEIGCGIGTDTVNFARHGAHVTAVDLSETSLEIARRRAEVYHLQNRIQYFQGNAEELSQTIPIEPYDLIYSFGVIHHTPNPARVIEQMRLYSYPGNTIKMMVYHRHSWKVFWVLLTYSRGQLWRLTDLVAQYSEAQTGCPVTYTYTRREIRDLLIHYKYHITDMQVDHIFPYRIADYIQYHYVKTWYWDLLPKPLFRLVERLFGWHLCVTATAL